MKIRLTAILLAILFLFTCTAAFAQEGDEVETCVYTVYNATGEKITELYLTDNNSGEKSENFAGEDGLDPQGIIQIGGENYDGYVVTLSFKTEGGYEAEFATLHFEDVPIALLPAPSEEDGEGEADPDATTGATPIAFAVPDFYAAYTLVNKTGEKVTEVTLTENHSGEALPFEFEAIEPDASYALVVSWPADKINQENYELTLAFKTEGGYEAAFGTLHFETVTINLLAADAMTGATPISFDY